LEKQRLRSQYNLHERQMRNYVQKAAQKQGNPEDNLVQLLETRLDAMVLRAGMARTINAARQYVNHRHILVNGRWVNMPGYQLKTGDVVTVKPASRDLPCFVEAREEMVAAPPAYLERDREAMSARLLYLPKRQEVPVSAEMILVFEHYSK
jgi:small subunit ribosomal protein S4